MIIENSAKYTIEEIVHNLALTYNNIRILDKEIHQAYVNKSSELKNLKWQRKNLFDKFCLWESRRIMYDIRHKEY